MTEGLRPRFRLWIRNSPLRGAIFFALAFPLAMALFFLVYFGPDRPPMPLRNIAVMLIALGAISGIWIYKTTKHLYPVMPTEDDEHASRPVPRSQPASQMLGRLSDRLLFWVMVVAGLSSIQAVVGFVTGFYSYGRWSEAVGFAITASTLKAAAGERRRRNAAPSARF